MSRPNKNIYKPSRTDCPVCGALLLAESKRYYDLFVCPNKVVLPNGKSYSHYYDDTSSKERRLYMLPYKIIMYLKYSLVYHQIRNPKTNSTSIQFKKMIEVPTEKINLLDPVVLMNRLNTWSLFK